MRVTMTKDGAFNLGLALLGGLLMRWSFGLHPVWWLAWVAPAPLLVAVLRSARWTAFALALLAGLIAASANLHYLATVMPAPAAALVMLLLALLWVLVVGQARRVMAATASPWAVLAYPLLWCAAGVPVCGPSRARLRWRWAAWVSAMRASRRRHRHRERWSAWP